MTFTRRSAMCSLLAAPALAIPRRACAAVRTLRISHQFPAATQDQGDFRDRLVRRFAAGVEQRTKGELAFTVHPASSLMKTVPQFAALRSGALDLSLYPLAYASDEMPEASIGLIPCLVMTYGQGMAWKTHPVGRELTGFLEQRGVKVVTWVWQAGSTACRTAPLTSPGEFRGLRVRGGSREMDLMFQDAGSVISVIPSNDIYAAMRAGTLDAAVTSSTSVASFRLQDVSKGVTVGGTGSFWFMFEPLLMSKQVFDGLPAAHRDAIVEVGAGLEDFGVEAAQADDETLTKVFRAAGGVAKDLDESSMDAWRTLAERTAWTEFASRNATCAKLIKLAGTVDPV